MMKNIVVGCVGLCVCKYLFKYVACNDNINNNNNKNRTNDNYS